MLSLLRTVVSVLLESKEGTEGLVRPTLSDVCCIMNIRLQNEGRLTLKCYQFLVLLPPWNSRRILVVHLWHVGNFSITWNMGWCPIHENGAAEDLVRKVDPILHQVVA